MSHQSRSSYSLTGPARIAYEKCLTFEGVPSKQHFYYCIRVNQFIKAGKGRDPGSLQVDEIGEILGLFGRDDKLTEWQFAQLLDAVRILLTKCLVSSASVKMDWSYWKASARSVSGDHSTTARENSPDELSYLKESKGSG